MTERIAVDAVERNLVREAYRRTSGNINGCVEYVKARIPPTSRAYAIYHENIPQNKEACHKHSLK